MTNKELLQDAFHHLAQGNAAPFIQLMADDFCWTVAGTTSWSGTYHGLAEVRDRLFAPLRAQFASPYRNTASRFIAEGDIVVVECQGEVTTRRGLPYNNRYCFVCRFAGGRLRALMEYCDTDLVARALDKKSEAEH